MLIVSFFEFHLKLDIIVIEQCVCVIQEIFVLVIVVVVGRCHNQRLRGEMCPILHHPPKRLLLMLFL